MAKNKSKAKRPSRDDFELEELGMLLNEAHLDQKEVVLTIWAKDPLQGIITKMDGQTQLIHVEKLGVTKKVPFMDILQIEPPTN